MVTESFVFPWLSGFKGEGLPVFRAQCETGQIEEYYHFTPTGVGRCATLVSGKLLSLETGFLVTGKD